MIRVILLKSFYTWRPDEMWVRENGDLVFATGVKDGFGYSHVVLGRESNGYYFTRFLNIPIDKTKSSAFEGYGEYMLSLQEALQDAGMRIAHVQMNNPEAREAAQII